MEPSLESTAILAREPGIAGHGADLDDAVVDFRHFLGEQLGHEARVGARQHDLRALGLATDVVDVGADAVADVEDLARDRLVAAHDAFATAQVDDDVAVLDALDGAVDDLADAILELFELALALGFADLVRSRPGGPSGSAPGRFEGRQVSVVGLADKGFLVARRRFRSGAGPGVLVLDLLGVVDHGHVRVMVMVSPVFGSMAARMSCSAP
jgi:hypothetical protein